MSGQLTRKLGIFAAATLLTPGCMSVFNRVPDPAPEVRTVCDSLPVPSRNNVHVVFFNGVDPLCCGNLGGVREHLNSLGFCKTYYAEIFHLPFLLDELKRAREEHPDARFAIVGFEYGSLPARALARKCVEEGVPVDLVVYLQPKGGWLGGSGVEGVGRTIVIRSGAAEPVGTPLENSDIVEIPSFTRYGVPTHPNTLSILGSELAGLAMGIPVVAPRFEPFPSMMDDPAPPPRPITVQQTGPADEWDFLKPTALRKPAAFLPQSVEAPAETALVVPPEE